MLSIASTALGQQSDSALTQSQADKIIEKMNELEKNMLKGMHDLELKMRDHVDKKFGELDDKFDELDKDVAVLKSDVSKLFMFLIGIAVAVFGHLLIFIGSTFYSNWRNKANLVPKVAAEIATKNATENELDPGVFLRQDNFRQKTESDSSILAVKPDDRR
ncbi:MAG: hypothetical protein OXI67_09900 [Candidatus Poribacteria bacterium]|nr:hypothetical protein [Candidatus Poribacteria bacterium]